MLFCQNHWSKSTQAIDEKSNREAYIDNLHLLGALVLHLHDRARLEKETSKLFAALLQNMQDVDLTKVQGVFMNGIPTVEGMTKTNVLLCIYIVDGARVWELARLDI